MTKRHLFILILFASIISLTIDVPPQNPAHVQADASLTCSEITQAAIRNTREFCTDLDRGFACYGNELVDAQPQANQPDFHFEAPGDISDIASIYSIQLSGMDGVQGKWGIVQMELQASIPEASPESVSMLLFGSVAVQNAGATHEPILVTVENELGIALRAEPGFASEVLKKANIRDRLWAYERSQDGQWLHVEVPATGELVWISMSEVASNPELEALPTSTGQTYYRPMQAVYLHNTSTSSTECSDFPIDGMLIQTPEGIGKVTLAVNEVIIELGSTALVEMTAPNLMTISLLEGHSYVTSRGVRQELPAGFSTTILLDQDMKPATIPSAIVEINPAVLNILTIGPGSVWMDEPVVQTQPVEEVASPANNNPPPESEKITKKKKTTKKEPK